jgi:hypothetical protein
MLSTRVVPEVVEYPELGTVRVLTRPPFDPPDPDEDPADRLMLLFDRAADKQPDSQLIADPGAQASAEPASPTCCPATVCSRSIPPQSVRPAGPAQRS